jgi:hypothetical protein
MNFMNFVENAGNVKENIGKLTEVIDQINQRNLKENTEMIGKINEMIKNLENMKGNINNNIISTSKNKNIECLFVFLENLLEELKKQMFSINFSSSIQKLFISYIFSNLERMQQKEI